MISVADLLVDNRIPGNYFAVDAYVRGDLEMGLLENRQGDRLLALPETLIQAIYSGLDKETGQATRLVLFNCGRWWGRSFYTRFCEQLTDYYNISTADMPMVEFLQSLQQCWVTHGWGKLDLDQTYQHRGFLVIKTWNSPFAKLAPNWNQPFVTWRQVSFLPFLAISPGATCTASKPPANQWGQTATALF